MRLPNGYGSVYKLSGNRRKPWTARITVGFNEAGQPKYHFLGYFATRQEALKCLADYNASPYGVENADMTLGEVFNYGERIRHINSAKRPYRHTIQGIGCSVNT